MDPNEDPGAPDLQGANTGVTGTTSVPTTVDLSGGDSSGGIGMAEDGTPWAQNVQNGGPIQRQLKDGSWQQMDVAGRWHQTQGPVSAPKGSGSGATTQSVPRSGMIYDRATGKFVTPGGVIDPNNPASGMGAWNPYYGMAGYHPIQPLNPGQMGVTSTGQVAARNPTYDPAQFALLAQEANRQYQLSISEAQRKWQSDRDVQAYRQAQTKAENDYRTQLIGIQSAQLQAQVAVQNRQFAQPVVQQLADGTTLIMKPNEMVGGIGGISPDGSSWAKTLEGLQPIQTADMMHAGQDMPFQLPDVKGTDAAADVKPGGATDTSKDQIYSDAAQRSSSMGLGPGGISATPPEAATGTGITPADNPQYAPPSDTGNIYSDADARNAAMGLGDLGPDTGSSWNGITPADIGSPPGMTPGVAADTGISPADLSGYPGPDLSGATGTGISPADLSGFPKAGAPGAGTGKPLDPWHHWQDIPPALGGVGSALWNAFKPDPAIKQRALERQAAGQQYDPFSNPQQGAGVGPPDLSGLGNAAGALFSPLPNPPVQQPTTPPTKPQYDPFSDPNNSTTIDVGQALSNIQWPDISGVGLPFLNTLTTPQSPPMVGPGAPGFGGAEGSGQDGESPAGGSLEEIGAGPGLGQSMAPPPGGLVPPVPQGQIVGLGHDFGTPTADETPFHKGVDFQALKGVPVISPVAGTVTSIGKRGDLGLSVIITDKAGQQHELNHLDAIAVQKGADVMPGDIVGKVGSTGNSSGPHLDYRVRGEGDDFVNPMSNPAIAGALQGMPDMSGEQGGGDMWVGSGQDDGSGDESSDGGDSGWSEGGDPGWDSGSSDGGGGGTQYNQQESDGSWSQITQDDQGNYSSTTIDPSQYSDYGIPGGDQGGDQGTSWDTGGSTAWGGDQTAAAAAAPGANPAAPNAQNPAAANTQVPGIPGVNRLPWDPSQFNAYGSLQTSLRQMGYGAQMDQLRASLDAQMQMQTQSIDAQKDMQVKALDAQYQQLLLQTTSAEQRLNLQIAYQDRHDKIIQDTEYRKMDVQQQMQAAHDSVLQQMAASAQASQERIAGTQARANVLGTWGRAAGASPWLSRLSGRTPTPGDLGAGTGYGQMSANSQALLEGGAQAGGYGDYVPGAQGGYGGSMQGWGGATSGGGEWPLGKGGAEDTADTVGPSGQPIKATPDQWGDASGNRLAYSLFGSGQGEEDQSGNMTDDSSNQTDNPMVDQSQQQDTSQPQQQMDYNGGGSYRPFGMDWGSNLSSSSNPGGFDTSWYGGDQSQQQQQTPSPAQRQQQATPPGGFAQSIDDLTANPNQMPTAPSLESWEQMGPFGQAAMRYGLESAGYNWAPYAEQMLAGWRDTGQQDVNTGMSGYSAPHVTALGMQSMNPMQLEGLQQNAELFGNWNDYLNREQRSWQSGARPMSRIRA